jgi:GDPmannose 4,6-dehydratase
VLLARELMRHGRQVVGTIRPGSNHAESIATYLRGVEVLELDVRSKDGFAGLLESQGFDEVYNLASMSSVAESWPKSELVAETNGFAVLRMLEAIRAYRDVHGTAPRFYEASTSEMFGITDQHPQTDTTPHHPRSPYAVSKSFAHHTTINFRESYGLFACSGILYNHESPLRGTRFVTRKITRAAAEIALGVSEKVTLGNLDIRRDWGSAADFVVSMRTTLEAEDPVDYVIATGESHSLVDFLVAAFDAAGLGSPWPYVEQDQALIRPAEVVELTGDATKAREQLGWTTTRSFEEIVRHMVQVDIERLTSGREHSVSYLDEPA